MKQKWVELAATFENGQCLKLFTCFMIDQALLWKIAAHSGVAVSQFAIHDSLIGNAMFSPDVGAPLGRCY
jgi:hypothetical protein